MSIVMHFFLQEFKLHTMLQEFPSKKQLASPCIPMYFNILYVAISEKNQTEAYDQRTIDLKSTLVSPCQYNSTYLHTRSYRYSAGLA